MRRRLAVPLAAVLWALSATLLCAPPAIAQERENSWEAGFFLGQTFYGNENRISNETNLGLRVGWNFKPAYELEFQYLDTTGSDLESEESTLIADTAVFFSNPGLEFGSRTYTLRFLINPRNERRRFKPYILFGGGIIEFTPDPGLDADEEGALDDGIFTFGGGIRQRLSGRMSFRAEFEVEYALSDSYSNQHLTAGLTWVFGGGSPADSDGDGILDIRDLCPDTPPGALVDKHDGCPWDLDRDGIMEGIDRCAETPHGWPVDEQGCPLDSDGDAVPDGEDDCADTMQNAIVDADGCPLDSDEDTILDGIDRCPGTPLGAFVDNVDSPTAGCPHDSDIDGIFDGVDQCVLTPPGAIVDERGCPHDSDGDRVLDGIDQCPDSPIGQRLDREGCPRVRLDKEEPQILQNVKFYGMELYPGADAWLELLVDAANYWMDVTFEVGVYTDNTGTPQANRQAARRRAEVLKGWLVQRGIDPNRIVINAYGAVNFIADNETEVGREENRRVEVKRVSGDIRKHPTPEPPPPEEPEEEPVAEPSEEAPATEPLEEPLEAAPSEEAPEAELPGEAPEAEPPEEAPEPELSEEEPEAEPPEVAPVPELPDEAPEAEPPEVAPEPELPDEAPEAEPPEVAPEPELPDEAPDAVPSEDESTEEIP